MKTIEGDVIQGLIKIKTDWTYGHTFEGAFSWITNTEKHGIRNIRDTEPLDGYVLELRGYVNDYAKEDSERFRYYVVANEVRHVSVDLRKAKQLVKLLTDVRRKVETYSQEWGRAESWKQELRYTLKAIGVAQIARESKHVGSSYADNEYQFLDVDSALWYLDCQRIEWEDSVRAKLSPKQLTAE